MKAMKTDSYFIQIIFKFQETREMSQMDPLAPLLLRAPPSIERVVCDPHLK